MIKSLPKLWTSTRRLFKKEKDYDGATAPLSTFSRDDHSISRKNISENALKVLYRLDKAGYRALLVGGGVRDTLLGLNPKDFDVATNATPEQVVKLFRNSRLIGRRFKLVHVVFGRDVIEVATFRAPPKESHSSKVASTGEHGMILRDNVYGSKDEDAMRRDFTVNALYYDIADFSLHSYAGGYEDLQAKRIRLIGDPETRYREDPVRMLRAVRFAAKLGFTIDEATAEPIKRLAPLLEQIPPARLFEEVLKLFLHGKALDTLRLLREYHLFEHLFPLTEQCLKTDKQALLMAENTMANTDTRIQSGKSVTPYFFMASLLWPALVREQKALESHGLPPHPALQKAADKIMGNQIKHIAIPKRLSMPMREIWEMQPRLAKITSRKVVEFLSHPRFRASYDFVLLREQSGEDLGGIGKFWTKLQEQNPEAVSRPSREHNADFDNREHGANDRDNRESGRQRNHAPDPNREFDDAPKRRRPPRKRTRRPPQSF